MSYLSYVPTAYECGTRPFLRWVLSQGRSPHASGSSKNASDPVGITLFGAPQAPGDKPNPSEEGKSLGETAPWDQRCCIQWWNTPERTVHHATTAGWERPITGHKPSQRTSHVSLFILRPTSVRIWHKAVFKVGPIAGPKPNAVGSSKNASDPVGIPLFGAPQAPGDKPNPSEEG